MDIRSIRTETDYDCALAEVEQYFVQKPKPGTEDADRFNALSALIEAYEAEAWPVDAPETENAVVTVMKGRSMAP